MVLASNRLRCRERPFIRCYIYIYLFIAYIYSIYILMMYAVLQGAPVHPLPARGLGPGQPPHRPVPSGRTSVLRLPVQHVSTLCLFFVCLVGKELISNKTKHATCSTRECGTARWQGGDLSTMHLPVPTLLLGHKATKHKVCGHHHPRGQWGCE